LPTRVIKSLREELQAIEMTLKGGSLGVAAIDGATGEIVSYNADWTFPTASVIKAPIVAELYAQSAEGKLKTTTTVTVAAEDFVGGSGVLAHLSPGHTFTLDELALLAIKESDNTASNLVLRAIGGPEVINQRMHNEWEMPNTTVHRPIRFTLTPDDPPHTATGTPQDMMRFMNAVATGTLHSPDICDKMVELLATPNDSSMLSRYLDINPFAEDLAVATPPLKVVHKPGAVNGVRNNAGIIRRMVPPFGHLAICAYTKGVPDPRWTVANFGCEAISRVGKLLAHRFFV